MAFFVAFEGIDGSGKGTQSRKLRESLLQSGVRSALVGFPRYQETFFGQRVADYLNGKYGTLSDAHPFLVSLLYAGDRFESRDYLRRVLAEHQVVVCDRFVPSNIAHQAAKLPPDQRGKLCQWIEHIEYELYQLPRPDLVVLLDLPVENAQSLIATKQRRSYTDKAADLQEADAEYLNQVRQVYLQLARDTANWRRIDCCRDNQVRGIDDLAIEIRGLVTRELH